MKNSTNFKNIAWFVFAILGLTISVIGTIISNSFLIITGAFIMLTIVSER